MKIASLATEVHYFFYFYGLTSVFWIAWSNILTRLEAVLNYLVIWRELSLVQCYPSLGSVYFNLRFQVLLGINHNCFIIA